MLIWNEGFIIGIGWDCRSCLCIWCCTWSCCKLVGLLGDWKVEEKQDKTGTLEYKLELVSFTTTNDDTGDLKEKLANFTKQSHMHLTQTQEKLKEENLQKLKELCASLLLCVSKVSEQSGTQAARAWQPTPTFRKKNGCYFIYLPNYVQYDLWPKLKPYKVWNYGKCFSLGKMFIWPYNKLLKL